MTRNSAARSTCSKSIPSAGDPAISVKEDFFAFNDKLAVPGPGTHHRSGRSNHARAAFRPEPARRLDLVRLALTPEAMLDGRRIEEFFRADFFATEFWLLWTTIMGPLPQHSAMEMRRYMNRFLHLLADLSVMSHVLRTPLRPVRGHHRTDGGVAAPAWRELPDGHVRPATSASRHRPAASRPAGSTTNATARRRRSSSRRRISCW